MSDMISDTCEEQLESAAVWSRISISQPTSKKNENEVEKKLDKLATDFIFISSDKWISRVEINQRQEEDVIAFRERFD